jgi:hypothetical protein
MTNRKIFNFQFSVFNPLVVAVALMVASSGCATWHPGQPDNTVSLKAVAGSAAELRAISNGWRTLYDLPQDNPARYALNEIAMRNHWRAFNLLRGDWPGSDADRAQAAERLVKLRKRIDTGIRWPFKTPPTYDIPFAASAPTIDGSLHDPAWKTALTFTGQYPIDSTEKIDAGSIWKLMWDPTNLYVAADFPDAGPIAAQPPYAGDSLEIFIMPSARMKMYWEVIVGCDGGLFDGLHCNDKWGGFAPGPANNIKGLAYRAVRTASGFSVEVAIPFSELPNYMLGNHPQPGQTLHFALVRTDKTAAAKDVPYFSPFPLLYGGHNIFGHAKGILKAPTR